MSQKRIKGKIVCHRRDEYGEIIVADDGAMRSLYFGGGLLQSSILLDLPGALVEDYSRAMMSCLMFMEAPRSVLVIGLGGCSLVNFLLRAFPMCVVDVVELRQQVIELARDFFLLPGKDMELSIFHIPGRDFMGQRGMGRPEYDLVLVDAFDEDGPAVSLLERDFLHACLKRLSDGGVFAINLWNRPKDNFAAMYAALREAFAGNTLRLVPAEACWNALVFGAGNEALFRDLPSYRKAARALQIECGIDFPRYLKYLYWQNYG